MKLLMITDGGCCRWIFERPFTLTNGELAQLRKRFHDVGRSLIEFDAKSFAHLESELAEMEAKQVELIRLAGDM